MTRARKDSKRLVARPPAARDEFLAELSLFIEELGKPIDEAEIRSGWSPERVAGIRNILIDTRDRVMRRESIPYQPLVRWADHMSITSGRWLETLSKIDVDLNHRQW